MRSAFAFAGVLSAAVLAAATITAQAPAPLAVGSAKVTITGTTNVHGYTAETTTVRLTGVKTGAFDGDLWALVEKPALVETFGIVIPAASLHSTKDGIDKNMHKALNVTEHPEIRFRLRSFEPAGTAYRATGMVTIAGVEKEVVLTLQVQRQGAALAVSGVANLLMTDFGVKPPSAMLGMVRSSPKIAVKLELTVAAS